MQTNLVTDALESGDPKRIAQALGVLARKHGMSALARETALSREALYRSLSSEGDPRLSTLTSVLRALGIRLTVAQPDLGAMSD